VLDQLSRSVIRHRRLVVGLWIVLTLFGVYSAQRVSSRWLEQFSIPGFSAYETNQHVLRTFGNGAQAPDVAVFHSNGDVTKAAGIGRTLVRFERAHPDFRVSSYFSTGNDAYVSRDRHTTFAEFYPPGQEGFNANDGLGVVRTALEGSAVPPGVDVNVTGDAALYNSEGTGGSNGPSVLTEALIGAAGALVILLFVFGTLPAVAMPLAMAAVAILNTFTLIWALTYVTSVSIIVQFLVALVGLGVAIDYSLLMIFRFREELSRGEDVETAVVQTVRHAGRSVVVSGSTVAIGLLSMVIIPIPVIRSIGIGGMLIPVVSVLAAITLLPALLFVLGHRVNRLRVMPRRLVQVADAEAGFWGRWARLVVRRPIPIAAAGIAVVALLLIPGVQLKPADPQAKDLAGNPADEGVIGFRQLDAAGISPGVLNPFVVAVEGPSGADLQRVETDLAATPGVSGAAAPPSWRRDGLALVEAFPSADSFSGSATTTISRLQDNVLPSLQASLGNGARLSLGGVAPEARDFVHAVYGKFPYVLAFVVLLTFVLLMRAFRSVFLPLKAVVLNLASLGAAFGIIVFVFQWGHGAESIWGVHPTDSIISWIPLMIFAFLYGLSMDYEVFMLTRMRETYDETGDTNRAISLGLARTGKLVTSAALVLMFAFFVLSTGPGVDIKQFGIGLAAGIIFDATVIRALLVPSVMRIAGRVNWWLPAPVERALLVRPHRPRTAEAE
jgi:RND superfamily putative drug exporter